MLVMGFWLIESDSDPRWNASGRSLVGMLVLPIEANNKIEELKKELGCDPPQDLRWQYLKD